MSACPECGARLTQGGTCTDLFHRLPALDQGRRDPRGPGKAGFHVKPRRRASGLRAAEPPTMVVATRV